MAYGTVNVDKTVTSWGDTTGGLYGFKNRIINGAMVISQRGTTFTPTTSNVYTLDRWKADKISSAVYTVDQVADAPTGFSNSLKVTVTTGAAPSASSYNRLIQCIEGFNTYDLGFGTGVAQNVSVSFWVKSSIAGLYPVALQNNATNRSYTATFTINSANTWEYKTVTIPVDTTGTWVGATNGIGLLVLFDLGSDSVWNQTAGSWAASNTWRTSGTVSLTSTTNATYQITGVQLEKGSTATSFDYRPYGTELALCQRYLPAFKTDAAGQGITGALGIAWSTTHIQIPIPFAVTPRVAPTGLTVTGTAPTASDGVASITSTALNIGGSGPTSCFIDVTVASGLTQYRPYYLYSGGSTTILFNGCEL